MIDLWKGINMDYDIALSFAGEDREYVEKIAYGLKEYGVKVFYDKFKTAELFGKDLYQYLNDIYKNKADYCIIFISEAYKKKAWTQHELASAQTRAFLDDKEYILPIYIDMVSVPGINETVGYITKKDYTISEIINIILEKLSFIDEDWFKCNNLQNLLKYAINKIYKISGTDFNQIALSTVSQQHSTNLYVVADIIARGKYRYNIITMWGVIGQSFRTGEIVYIKDVSQCDFYVNAVKETNSELVIPVKMDGNVVGVINIESEEIDFLGEEQFNLLKGVSRNLGIMLKRINYEIQFIEDLPMVYRSI